MGQLTKEQADQLWPEKSQKIYFLCHTLNDDEKALLRCILSVRDLADKIVVLVDDKAACIVPAIVDYATSFTWKHSFSYAKNLCLQTAMDRCGLKYGDWVLFMGDDFELQSHTIPEIKEFIKDPCNFFAQFWVPEYTPNDGEKVVSRKRKLLWRHHPMIYWERSVHEEAVYSAYRLTGQGIPFGEIEWKEYPILGGINGMLHYGYHEDGGEHGKYFWWKKGYYLVLMQIDQVRNKYNLPETLDATKRVLEYILNRPVTDLNLEIEKLTERYSNGDVPPGLSKFVDPKTKIITQLEYDN